MTKPARCRATDLALCQWAVPGPWSSAFNSSVAIRRIPGICVSATIVTVVRFRPPAGPCAFDGRKYLSRQGYDSVMCYNLLSDFGRRRLWAFNWRKYPMICRRCHDDLSQLGYRNGQVPPCVCPCAHQRPVPGRAGHREISGRRAAGRRVAGSRVTGTRRGADGVRVGIRDCLEVPADTHCKTIDQ